MQPTICAEDFGKRIGKRNLKRIKSFGNSACLGGMIFGQMWSFITNFAEIEIWSLGSSFSLWWGREGVSNGPEDGFAVKRASPDGRKNVFRVVRQFRFHCKTIFGVVPNSLEHCENGFGVVPHFCFHCENVFGVVRASPVSL